MDDWEHLLTPEIARGKLISASLYITAFELLRESIIERPRSFYGIGLLDDAPMVGEDYRDKVLSRNRSVLYASLDWLLDHDALSKSDLDTFESIKAARNDLAHGLPALILGHAAFPHAERFQDLVALLRKIEVWWLVNVEIPSNPEFEGREINEAGIVPGPVLILQMMLEVVSGDDKLLEAYRSAKKPQRTA